MKQVLVFVEGIEGVGKTTLCQQLLEKHPEWVYIKEPSAITRNIVKKLYERYMHKPKSEWEISWHQFLEDLYWVDRKVQWYLRKKQKAPVYIFDRCFISSFIYQRLTAFPNWEYYEDALICDLNHYIEEAAIIYGFPEETLKILVYIQPREIVETVDPWKRWHECTQKQIYYMYEATISYFTHKHVENFFHNIFFVQSSQTGIWKFNSNFNVQKARFEDTLYTQQYQPMSQDLVLCLDSLIAEVSQQYSIDI